MSNPLVFGARLFGSDEDILGAFRQSQRHPWYPNDWGRQMTKMYAFVLVPLVITLTVATAWGQTSGGPETVVVHSGSATLHAMLWRPQGRGPFPAILLNHGSGRTRDELERLGPYERNAEKLGPVFARQAMYSCTCLDAASGFPRTRALTPLT